MAMSTVRGIARQAASEQDRDKADELWKWAHRSQHETRITALLKLASVHELIVLAANRLDADPWLLNVKNGTLDLRTGKLRAPRREDYITKLAPVEFHRDAECPRWLQFLEEVFAGDKQLIAFVQRVVGYCLTADTREQCLFMLHGTGANGKTTLLEIVAVMLGEYARRADASSFTTAHRRSVRSDLARLRGARFVPAVEVESDARLAEVLVKQVTGGDTIVASHLYHEEFEFRPTFKVALTVNDLPEIRGEDFAIWRRVRTIPFDVRISKPDRTLPAKLHDELSGILAWAVRGCLQWQRRGLGQPGAVVEATESYRTDMDALRDFLDERCALGPNRKALNASLWTAYLKWSDRHAIRHPLTHKELTQRLKARGFVQRRGKVKGKTQRYWCGLALRKGSK
jgi:putative DNA primase/helicase